MQVALRALGFPVKKSEVQALIARHGDATGNISRTAWEQICRDSMRNRDAGEQLARSGWELWWVPDAPASLCRGSHLGTAEAVCRLRLPRMPCRAFQLFDVDADGKITVSDSRQHDDLLCTPSSNGSLACAMQVQDLRAVARELGQAVDEQDLMGMVRAWEAGFGAVCCLTVPLYSALYKLTFWCSLSLSSQQLTLACLLICR